MLRASDAFAIPFGLLWCGFAIFWEWSVVSGGRAPWFFELWGVPFVAVGLYLVFGRFIADAYQRGRTVYGITWSPSAAQARKTSPFRAQPGAEQQTQGK